MWGERKSKYERLWEGSLPRTQKQRIEPQKPYYFFRNFDQSAKAVYFSGFGVSDFFRHGSSGCVSAKDRVNYSFTKAEAVSKIRFLKSQPDSEIRNHFGIKAKDARDWKVSTAKADAIENTIGVSPTEALYRPFDNRLTFYTGNSRGLYASPQIGIMKHMQNQKNIGLTVSKVNRQKSLGYVFITDKLVDFHIHDSIGDSTSLFPLYLFSNEGELIETHHTNFDPKLWEKLQGLAEHPDHGRPDEVQTFDYIYGVLYCPAYRNAYSEFLKIDFPRIPWPKSPDEFWNVSAKGGVLRQLHLMDIAAIGLAPYRFEGKGDSVVGKVRYEGGRVWINKTQYFDNVPEVSWSFYIGGYQPARKWLKDRKGRALSFDDIQHYQRIINILAETDLVMKTITMDLEV